MNRTIRNAALIVAAVSLLQSCAAVADGTPAGPDTEITTPGAIALEMVAEGTALDPDGYTVRVGGVSRGAVAVKGTTWIRDVPPGGAELLLGGVAPTCTVNGDNPRVVAVPPGDVVRVTVSVTCSEEEGSAT
jgi:hypothetical protein